MGLSEALCYILINLRKPEQTSVPPNLQTPSRIFLSVKWQAWKGKETHCLTQLNSLEASREVDLAVQFHHRGLTFSLTSPSAIYRVGFISRFQIEAFFSWWQQFQPLQFFNPVLGEETSDGSCTRLTIHSHWINNMSYSHSWTNLKGQGQWELISPCSIPEVRGGLSF